MGILNLDGPTVPIVHIGTKVREGAWPNLISPGVLWPNQQPHNHGTAACALVNHPTYGMAKNAKVYNVTATQDGHKEGVWPSGAAMALEWICDNFQEPVVAFGSIEADFWQEPRLLAATDRFFAAGHALVWAAGNSNMEIPMVRQGQPAGWPCSDPRAIIVGAYDEPSMRRMLVTDTPMPPQWPTGIGSDWTPPGRRMIYADGVGEKSLYADDKEYPVTGTSFAAPRVAAVMAVHMGRGLSAVEAYEAMFWAGHAMTSSAHKVVDAKVSPADYAILTKRTGILSPTSPWHTDNFSFDPVEYKRLNPDVAAEIGVNFIDAHHHLKHYGLWEGHLGRKVREAFT